MRINFLKDMEGFLYPTLVYSNTSSLKIFLRNMGKRFSSVPLRRIPLFFVYAWLSHYNRCLLATVDVLWKEVSKKNFKFTVFDWHCLND